MRFNSLHSRTSCSQNSSERFFRYKLFSKVIILGLNFRLIGFQKIHGNTEIDISNLKQVVDRVNKIIKKCSPVAKQIKFLKPKLPVTYCNVIKDKINTTCSNERCTLENNVLYIIFLTSTIRQFYPTSESNAVNSAREPANENILTYENSNFIWIALFWFHHFLHLWVCECTMKNSFLSRASIGNRWKSRP